MHVHVHLHKQFAKKVQSILNVNLLDLPFVVNAVEMEQLKYSASYEILWYHCSAKISWIQYIQCTYVHVHTMSCSMYNVCVHTMYMCTYRVTSAIAIAFSYCNKEMPNLMSDSENAIFSCSPSGTGVFSNLYVCKSVGSSALLSVNNTEEYSSVTYFFSLSNYCSQYYMFMCIV